MSKQDLNLSYDYITELREKIISTSADYRYSIDDLSLLIMGVVFFGVWILTGSFLIALIVGIVEIVIYYAINYPKARKAEDFIDKAYKAAKYELFEHALIFLEEAQKLKKTRKLRLLIEEIENILKLPEKRELEQMLQDKEQIKNPKVKEVLNELINLQQKIIQYKNKILILEFNLKLLDEQQQSQYIRDLKEQYQNTLKLLKSKLDFYKQQKAQLQKIYNSLKFYQDLQQEQSKITQLEDKYLKDSVLQEHEKQEFDNLIQFYQNYIQTLHQLSKDIDQTQDIELISKLQNQLQQNLKNIENETSN